tara:strand:- start:1272 stop:1595 length:324 start_codon:yes stop_codon:yes gene_type:complete
MKLIKRFISSLIKDEVQREVERVAEKVYQERVRVAICRMEHRAVDLTNGTMDNRGLRPARLYAIEKNIEQLDEEFQRFRGHLANDFACVKNKVNRIERGSHDVSEMH